jgi:formylglycine-generating enzyme required for sulfatase activity
VEYRLPTEAEWEYACRAGTTTPFYTGATISRDKANYDGGFAYGNGAKGIYRGRTMRVGSFLPNGFGLYDMHGNVWEWCQDWYGENYYANSPTDDPKGPDSAVGRVFRGCSRGSNPGSMRSASRLSRNPTFWDLYLGFRVVGVVEE